ADRGPDHRSRLRTRALHALHGGAGSGEEARVRLEDVLARFRQGLDERLLEALFAPEPHAAVLCAQELPLTMADCDALLAAAARERAIVPYVPPDDGRALQRALQSGRVGRRDARAVVEALRRGMLGVPRSLTNDERGRAMLRLLEACPGALASRESQVRAWHVGPTEPMARCLGQEMNRLGEGAVAAARDWLGMPESAARAFLAWAGPAQGPAASISEPTSSGAGVASGGTSASSVPYGPASAAARPGPTLGDVPAMLAEARAHFQAGRFPQAASAYERVSLLDPGNARAHAGLGSARLRLGNAPGAITAFRSALAIEPRNAAFHAMLGDALAHAGDRAGAERAYRQALALQPDHPQAVQGLMRLGVSPAASSAAPSTSAVAAPAPPARGTDPSAAARAEGRVHFQAGRFREAAAAYERAVAIDPNNAAAFAGLGASRLRLQEWPAARGAYEMAVRLQPDNASHWAALARAQAETGDRQAAIASLQRALRIDPNHAQAREGLRRLGATPTPTPSSPAPVASTPAMSAGVPPAAPFAGPAPPPPSGPVGPAAPTLPEVPTRDQIVQALRPLQGPLESCAPAFRGRVTFRIGVAGATGDVVEASMDGGPEGPEAECMLGLVRGVRFPRFARATLAIAYPFALAGPAAPPESGESADAGSP
ncbi:MAG: tetratricopeptide repeat protein, partial [Myxococcota bacterium]|nr:tetratricopeptide repeat protein [Myxococcota bacterium]